MGFNSPKVARFASSLWEKASTSDLYDVIMKAVELYEANRFPVRSLEYRAALVVEL